MDKENLGSFFHSKTTEIRGRDYDEYLSLLFLDIETIPKHATVASLGEGLSNFANQLSVARPDITVIGIDPIYAAGVKSTDTGTITEQKLKNTKFKTNGIIAANEKDFSEKSAATYIAADAKKLPFEDNTLDRIYMVHLVEHVDCAEIFPELARVIKPNGEIRSNNNPMQMIPKDDGHLFVTPGRRKQDMYDGTILTGLSNTNIVEALKKMADLGFRCFAIAREHNNYEGKLIETFALSQNIPQDWQNQEIIEIEISKPVKTSYPLTSGWRALAISK